MTSKSTDKQSALLTLFHKAISVFILLLFLVNDLLFFPSQGLASASPIHSGGDVRLTSHASANVHEVDVPPELGSITKVYEGTKGPYVVLLRDAHAVYSAQKSIHEIIEHFYNKYGMRDVFLEGAEGEIDTTFLKQFPDQKVLADELEYFSKEAGLSGAFLALAKSGNELKGFGAEDATLYFENIRAYLRAQSSVTSIENNLNEMEATLKVDEEEEAASAYNQKYLSYELGDFSLIDWIKYLHRVSEKGLVNYPSLLNIYAVISEREKQSVEEKKSFLAILSILLHADLGFKVQKDIQSIKQSWLTEKVDIMDAAERVYQIAQRAELPLSEKNQELLDYYHTLSMEIKSISIKTLREELLQAEEATHLKIFTDGDAQSRHDEFHRLVLAKKLIRFKLTRAEWELFKTDSVLMNQTPLQPFIDFYEIAESREAVFKEGLRKRIRQNEEPVLFVSGGFHTESVSEYLENEEISYIVISPVVGGMPDEGVYHSLMKGEVVWKEYLSEESGKIDLGDAFNRALVAKVKKDQPFLWRLMEKRWHDNLIRYMANNERVAEHATYTKFLSALKKSDIYGGGQWKSRLDHVISGLALLKQQDKLSLENVQALFAKPAAVHLFALPVGMVPSDLIVPRSIKSEKVKLDFLSHETARSESRFRAQNQSEQSKYTKSVQGVLGYLARIQDPNESSREALAELLAWQRRNGGSKVRKIYGRIDAPAQIIIGHLDGSEFFPKFQSAIALFLNTVEKPETYKWIVRRLLSLASSNSDSAFTKNSNLLLRYMTEDPHSRRRHRLRGLLSKASENGVSLEARALATQLVGGMTEANKNRSEMRLPLEANPNLLLAVNMMDLGIEVLDSGDLDYMNNFNKLRNLLPSLKLLGIKNIYLYGLADISNLSKQVHQVTTNGTHFIYSGHAIVKVENYKTQKKKLGDVELRDQFGNIFSIADMRHFNPKYAERGENPKAGFETVMSDIRNKSMKATADFIPWLSPDAINEKNYRQTFYLELPDQDSEVFGTLGSETDRQRWIEELLSRPAYQGYFAVRLNEGGRERVILVRHLAFFGGHSADQALLNPYHPEVYDYYLSSLKQMIDLGVSGVRVDLGHLLLKKYLFEVFSEMTAKGVSVNERLHEMGVSIDASKGFYEWFAQAPELWKKLIDDAKLYAESQNKSIEFLMETYDPQDQQTVLNLGADRVYDKSLFDQLTAFSESSGKMRADTFLWNLMSQAAISDFERTKTHLFFPTNFDQISLKNLGIPLPVVSMVTAVMTKMGQPVMVDLRDFLYRSGQVAKIVGGSEDPKDPHGHPFVSAEEIADYDGNTFPQLLNEAAWSRAWHDLGKAGPGHVMQDFRILDNEAKERFFSFAWRNDQSEWVVVILDLQPENTKHSVKVRLPDADFTAASVDPNDSSVYLTNWNDENDDTAYEVVSIGMKADEYFRVVKIVPLENAQRSEMRLAEDLHWFFSRTNWREEGMDAGDYQFRMAVLAEKLSKILTGENAERRANELEALLEEHAHQPFLLQEAEHLIRSFTNVYRMEVPEGENVVVGVEFSTYGEQNRMRPKSHHNPTGEDSIAQKINQLDQIFSVNPRVSYKLLIIDDGERKSADGVHRDDEFQLEIIQPTVKIPKFVFWLFDEAQRWLVRALNLVHRIIHGKTPKKTVPKIPVSAKSSGEVALDILQSRFSDRLDSGQVEVRFINPEDKKQMGGRKGSGILLGMRKLLEDGADYVIFTDTDLATHLGQIGLLLGPLARGDADAAIGSRWRQSWGSVVYNRSGEEKASSLLYNLVAKIFLGVWSIRDTQCGFKGFTREILQKMLPIDSSWRVSLDFTYNFAFDTHILSAIKRIGKRIKEIPIVWIDSTEESTLGAEGKVEALLSLAKQGLYYSRSEIREDSSKNLLNMRQKQKLNPLLENLFFSKKNQIEDADVLKDVLLELTSGFMFSPSVAGFNFITTRFLQFEKRFAARPTRMKEDVDVVAPPEDVNPVEEQVNERAYFEDNTSTVGRSESREDQSLLFEKIDGKLQSEIYWDLEIYQKLLSSDRDRLQQVLSSGNDREVLDSVGARTWGTAFDERVLILTLRQPVNINNHTYRALSVKGTLIPGLGVIPELDKKLNGQPAATLEIKSGKPVWAQIQPWPRGGLLGNIARRIFYNHRLAFEKNDFVPYSAAFGKFLNRKFVFKDAGRNLVEQELGFVVTLLQTTDDVRMSRGISKIFNSHFIQYGGDVSQWPDSVKTTIKAYVEKSLQNYVKAVREFGRWAKHGNPNSDNFSQMNGGMALVDLEGMRPFLEISRSERLFWILRDLKSLLSTLCRLDGTSDKEAEIHNYAEFDFIGTQIRILGIDIEKIFTRYYFADTYKKSERAMTFLSKLESPGRLRTLLSIVNSLLSVETPILTSSNRMSELRAIIIGLLRDEFAKTFSLPEPEEGDSNDSRRNRSEMRRGKDSLLELVNRGEFTVTSELSTPREKNPNSAVEYGEQLEFFQTLYEDGVLDGMTARSAPKVPFWIEDVVYMMRGMKLAADTHDYPQWIRQMLRSVGKRIEASKSDLAEMVKDMWSEVGRFESIQKIHLPGSFVATIALQTMSKEKIRKQIRDLANRPQTQALLLMAGGHPVRKTLLGGFLNNTDWALREATAMKDRGEIPEGIQLWATWNPYISGALESLRKKIEAGAEVIITQPGLLPAVFEDKWEEVKEAGLLERAQFKIGTTWIQSTKNLRFWYRLLGVNPDQNAEAISILKAWGVEEEKGFSEDFRNDWNSNRFKRAMELPESTGIHLMMVNQWKKTEDVLSLLGIEGDDLGVGAMNHFDLQRIFSDQLPVPPPYEIDDLEFHQPRSEARDYDKNISKPEVAQTKGVIDYQEDRYVFERIDVKPRHGKPIRGWLLAVFDGHSNLGKGGGAEVASILKRNMVKAFQNALKGKGRNIEKAFERTYQTLNERTIRINYSGSGLTAVFIPDSAEKFHVLIVGDSALFLRKNGKLLKTERSLASNAEERQRHEEWIREVKKARQWDFGKDGFRFRMTGEIPDRRLEALRDDPDNPSSKSEFSLTLLRSFGDAHFGNSLIRKPLITSFDLSEAKEPIELLLATNGVFDVIGAEEIDQYLARSGSAEEIIQAAGGEKASDNVTAIRFRVMPNSDKIWGSLWVRLQSVIIQIRAILMSLYKRTPFYKQPDIVLKEAQTIKPDIVLEDSPLKSYMDEFVRFVAELGEKQGALKYMLRWPKALDLPDQLYSTADFKTSLNGVPFWYVLFIELAYNSANLYQETEGGAAEKLIFSAFTPLKSLRSEMREQLDPEGIYTRAILRQIHSRRESKVEIEGKEKRLRENIFKDLREKHASAWQEAVNAHDLRILRGVLEKMEKPHPKNIYRFAKWMSLFLYLIFPGITYLGWRMGYPIKLELAVFTAMGVAGTISFSPILSHYLMIDDYNTGLRRFAAMLDELQEMDDGSGEVGIGAMDTERIKSLLAETNSQLRSEMRGDGDIPALLQGGNETDFLFPNPFHANREQIRNAIYTLRIEDYKNRKRQKSLREARLSVLMDPQVIGLFTNDGKLALSTRTVVEHRPGSESVSDQHHSQLARRLKLNSKEDSMIRVVLTFPLGNSRVVKVNIRYPTTAKNHFTIKPTRVRQFVVDLFGTAGKVYNASDEMDFTIQIARSEMREERTPHEEYTHAIFQAIYGPLNPNEFRLSEDKQLYADIFERLRKEQPRAWRSATNAYNIRRIKPALQQMRLEYVWAGYVLGSILGFFAVVAFPLIPFIKKEMGHVVDINTQLFAAVAGLMVMSGLYLLGDVWSHYRYVNRYNRTLQNFLDLSIGIEQPILREKEKTDNTGGHLQGPAHSEMRRVRQDPESDRLKEELKAIQTQIVSRGKVKFVNNTSLYFSWPIIYRGVKLDVTLGPSGRVFFEGTDQRTGHYRYLTYPDIRLDTDPDVNDVVFQDAVRNLLVEAALNGEDDLVRKEMSRFVTVFDSPDWPVAPDWSDQNLLRLAKKAGEYLRSIKKFMSFYGKTDSISIVRGGRMEVSTLNAKVFDHAFGNDFAILAGWLELMENDLVLNPDMEKRLKSIRQSLDAMSEKFSKTRFAHQTVFKSNFRTHVGILQLYTGEESDPVPDSMSWPYLLNLAFNSNRAYADNDFDQFKKGFDLLIKEWPRIEKAIDGFLISSRSKAVSYRLYSDLDSDERIIAQQAFREIGHENAAGFLENREEYSPDFKRSWDAWIAYGRDESKEEPSQRILGVLAFKVIGEGGKVSAEGGGIVVREGWRHPSGLHIGSRMMEGLFDHLKQKGRYSPEGISSYTIRQIKREPAAQAFHKKMIEQWGPDVVKNVFYYENRPGEKPSDDISGIQLDLTSFAGTRRSEARDVSSSARNKDEVLKKTKDSAKSFLEFFPKPDGSNLDVFRKQLDQIAAIAFDVLFNSNRIQGRTGPSIPADEIRKLFASGMPAVGESLPKILEQIREDLMKHSIRIGVDYHAHVINAPLPIAVFVDLIISAANLNNVLYESSGAGTILETQLIKWMAELIGYDPEKAGGVVLSGGAASNLESMIVARSYAVDQHIRKRLVQLGRDPDEAPDPKERGLINSVKDIQRLEEELGLSEEQRFSGKFVVFTTPVAHNSVKESVQYAGIGSDNIDWVETRNGKMDPEDLEKKIREHRELGDIIVSVVTLAGTTEEGKYDPIEEIIRIAKSDAENPIWVHVDAAYGGAVMFSEKYKHLARGIDQADSVTLDPHKLMYMPYAISVLLYKDDKTRDYLQKMAEYGVRDDEKHPNLTARSMPWSKRFDALKLWVALKFLGKENFGKLIEHTFDEARRIAEEVLASSHFELISTPETNQFAFRFVPHWMQDELQEAKAKRDWNKVELLNGQLNRINIQLIKKLQEDGYWYFVRTKLEDTPYRRDGDFSESNKLAVVINAHMNPFSEQQVLRRIYVHVRDVGYLLLLEEKLQGLDEEDVSLWIQTMELLLEDPEEMVNHDAFETYRSLLTDLIQRTEAFSDSTEKTELLEQLRKFEQEDLPRFDSEDGASNARSEAREKFVSALNLLNPEVVSDWKVMFGLRWLIEMIAVADPGAGFPEMFAVENVILDDEAVRYDFPFNEWVDAVHQEDEPRGLYDALREIAFKEYSSAEFPAFLNPEALDRLIDVAIGEGYFRYAERGYLIPTPKLLNDVVEDMKAKLRLYAHPLTNDAIRKGMIEVLRGYALFGFNIQLEALLLERRQEGTPISELETYVVRLRLSEKKNEKMEIVSGLHLTGIASASLIDRNRRIRVLYTILGYIQEFLLAHLVLDGFHGGDRYWETPEFFALTDEDLLTIQEAPDADQTVYEQVQGVFGFDADFRPMNPLIFQAVLNNIISDQSIVVLSDGTLATMEDMTGLASPEKQIEAWTAFDELTSEDSFKVFRALQTLKKMILFGNHDMVFQMFDLWEGSPEEASLDGDQLARLREARVEFDRYARLLGRIPNAGDDGEADNPIQFRSESRSEEYVEPSRASTFADLESPPAFFEEAMERFPGAGLKALDVGTGNGSFLMNLARDHPGRFKEIVGIDKVISKDETREENGTSLSLKGISLEKFASDEAYSGYFDTIFINCPAISVLDNLPLLSSLLKPDGLIFVTFHWAMFMNESYNAFEEETDVDRFLKDVAKHIHGPFGYWILDNLKGYPSSYQAYSTVPGILVIFKDDVSGALPSSEVISRSEGREAQILTQPENEPNNDFSYHVSGWESWVTRMNAVGIDVSQALKGKILNIGVESMVGRLFQKERINENNLVTHLKSQGLDIVGLTPLADSHTSQKHESGYIAGKVQDMSQFESDSFDTVIVAGLFDDNYIARPYLRSVIQGYDEGNQSQQEYLRNFYQAAIKEISRVLKPSGKLIILLSGDVNGWMLQALSDWRFSHIWHEIGPFLSDYYFENSQQEATNLSNLKTDRFRSEARTEDGDSHLSGDSHRSEMRLERKNFSGAVISERTDGLIVVDLAQIREPEVVNRVLEALETYREEELREVSPQFQKGSFWGDRYQWEERLERGQGVWFAFDENMEIDGILNFVATEEGDGHILRFVTRHEGPEKDGFFMMDTFFQAIRDHGIQDVYIKSASLATPFYRKYFEGYIDRQGIEIAPHNHNGVIKDVDFFKDDFKVTLESPVRSELRRDYVVVAEGIVAGVVPSDNALMRLLDGVREDSNWAADLRGAVHSLLTANWIKVAYAEIQTVEEISKVKLPSLATVLKSKAATTSPLKIRGVMPYIDSQEFKIWFGGFLSLMQKTSLALGSRLDVDLRLVSLTDNADVEFRKTISKTGMVKIHDVASKDTMHYLKRYLEDNPNAFVYGLENVLPEEIAKQFAIQVVSSGRLDWDESYTFAGWLSLKAADIASVDHAFLSALLPELQGGARLSAAGLVLTSHIEALLRESLLNELVKTSA